LARFNAGDQIGALTVLDDLRAARDTARQKRANIESAAEGRRIATLALEARTQGKLTTAQLITRFEQVTRLDPGVFWDWIELGRLYDDAGNLPAALRAAKMAADTAQSERDRSVALDAQADVLVLQGNLAAALEDCRVSLLTREHLAQADPGNAERQYDLSASQDRIGNVLVVQGNLSAALESYRASFAILYLLALANPGNPELQRGLALLHDKMGRLAAALGKLPVALLASRVSHENLERLAQVDPSNALWQHSLAVSQDKIGDVLVGQGVLPPALESFRASYSIFERLAQTDPTNAGWQRDVWVSMWRLAEYPDSGVTWAQVVARMEAMERSGVLLPADRDSLERARRNAQAASR
jgi:tetratricopeptide (TPR) repeat protein